MAAAAIMNLRDSTTLDASGAVRSVQAADVVLSGETLAGMWSPAYLERLARTYWRFLTRVTLGLVRVRYTESERSVVLVGRPLKLLTFAAPEYELEPDHGVVRWRVKRGLLVARAGHEGEGHLQIDVRRTNRDGAPGGGAPGGETDGRETDGDSTDGGAEVGAAPGGGSAVDDGMVRLHVEVEVANFYPAIAHGISRWAYNATQSRVHVFVTHGFLRSLARLDLARSRVGRLAAFGPDGGD